ncbi:hypothetical protein [Frankia sp. Cppng1_Ct_nod]|nr:hypothetical protein [Frankia sp. Cppng1_Ct_nod]
MIAEELGVGHAPALLVEVQAIDSRRRVRTVGWAYHALGLPRPGPT